ncbi:sodium/proline symporter [Chlorogloeopsis fritschii PCC 9212]|uniref:Sodium/proline symporter n=1 Tax=Chlorogloeopsis fritschii PCC 6912 TaxID=211165 RepID=A0A433N2H6_CHLFR|nr:sodium/proline symporter [Chlorogloeopsis fritschii]MBF2007325.1 sodium/proline symporter [Chlorogloeopsis fritschii C42_A2020_084]RUR75306.1 sodium:proline symporter [Chlorogloeopsis fritschii PCC 6912]
MASQLSIAVTFIAFLALIIFVGIYSATHKQNTTADYLLASRGVNPWLTALSAMSTGQSGLLFLGQVGFAYKIGISSIWLVIGWAIGDYIAWWFFFKRLRQVSEETSSDTVSALLAQNTSGARWISIVSGVIIIAFLGSYAASQLVAGSKALNVVFGWDYYLGIVLGTIIVIIYCFSGGVRAEIWTDAAQGIIMIGSLLLLLTVAIANGGGVAELLTKLAAIDPKLVSLSPTNLPLGFIPFLFGWIVAGFGVVGQPHILTRAMAIDSPDNVNQALYIKTVCGLVNSFCAIGVGLAARVLLPGLMDGGDPELALPYLAQELLPSIFVGLMLAGVFAATMSTADSQILCCSAALTQDIFPNFANSYKLVKLGTLTVAMIVLSIALAGDDNVFLLVTFSWSALASALGPLLILRVWQLPVSTSVALSMMGVGITAAMTWSLIFKWSSIVYEVLPGMAASTLVYLVARFMNANSFLDRKR